jgi:hypothetical protein
MHLLKDNEIIITKAEYTAEQFIQKRIELFVNLNKNIFKF